VFYKHRELPRLWEIEIYEQDPHEHPETATQLLTIVAWNAVGAIRGAGKQAVAQPRQLCFVTHPEQDPEGKDQIYRVNDPKEGPLFDSPVVPTIGLLNNGS